jgi:tetraacyldisaccharide 4'-kinase
MNAGLVWLASAVWSTLSEAARIGVAAGLLKQVRLGTRVVSVGNIQVGGAGKTPLVARIAREAAERGLKTCILCRGYGGDWESRGGVIAPGDAGVEAAAAGDEAALLHDLAPRSWIGVGADRVRQLDRVRERAGELDLVILDDGFQHWRIHRDVDVVAVTDADRRRTLFRDWGGALHRAHLIVWTKGESWPRGLLKPSVRVRFRLPEAEVARKRIWLVAGLAEGWRARQSIEGAGYQVERFIEFPDHARYGGGIVQGIVEGASRAGMTLAITGKDWVKWRDLGVAESRVRVLEPELVFEEGRDTWERVLWGS